MKNFLKSLQDIQDECIGRDGSKKEVIAPNQVAGATIRCIDSEASHEEWGQIRNNVIKHTKDWKRFKEDPNKVVIEKNFLLNSLDLMKAFFVFRPIDDEGTTYLKVEKGFYSFIPKDKAINGAWFIITAAIIIALSFEISFYFFISLLVIPIMFRLDKMLEINNNRKKNEWQNDYAKKPSKLFSLTSSSFISQQDLTIESVVKINFTTSPFKLEYSKLIDKLTINAHDMKGKVVWLWRYNELIDELKFSHSRYNSCGLNFHSLDIKIDLKGSSIMPAIETENSFIFFLDNFNDEMDKEQFMDSLYLSIVKQKIKNAEGTIFNDVLFKPYQSI